MTRMDIQYTLDGKSWTLDVAALTVDDYIEIKKVTGYRPGQWAVELDALDAAALKAAVWLARRQAGEKLDWSDPGMAFKVSTLGIKVLRDDTATADESGKAPGPTGARTATRAQKTRTSKSK